MVCVCVRARVSAFVRLFVRGVDVLFWMSSLKNEWHDEACKQSYSNVSLLSLCGSQEAKKKTDWQKRTAKELRDTVNFLSLMWDSVAFSYFYLWLSPSNLTPSLCLSVDTPSSASGVSPSVMKALISPASTPQLLNEAQDRPRKLSTSIPPSTPLPLCDFQILCRLKVTDLHGWRSGIFVNMCVTGLWWRSCGEWGR